MIYECKNTFSLKIKIKNLVGKLGKVKNVKRVVGGAEDKDDGKRLRSFCKHLGGLSCQITP